MTVTLIAIARNEGRYLPEWISYHLAIGYSKIIVYDHQSTDRTFEILSAISTVDKRVEVKSWSSQVGVSPQTSAYNDAVKSVKTEWLSILDIDEYIVPYNIKGIKNFLESIPEIVSSVHINWLGFGSGEKNDENYNLVIDNFLRRSNNNWINNAHYKTIARTKRVQEIFVHDIETIYGERVLSDGKGFEAENRGIANRIVHHGIRINHYQSKTYEEFRKRMLNGEANFRSDGKINFRDGSRERFDQIDRNEVFDLTIHRHRRAFMSEYEVISSAVGHLLSINKI